MMEALGATPISLQQNDMYTALQRHAVDGTYGAWTSFPAFKLESSNVDLSSELVTLISYQRAFEANSKTVTTADQMMQDVTNLAR